MQNAIDMTLYINTNAMDALQCHAEDASPDECCGILVGTWGGDTTALGSTNPMGGSHGPRSHDHAGHHAATVGSIIPAENVATTDRRISYQIDWKTLFHTIRSVRSTPQQILGFYHSHPDGSTEPSRRDRETAWIGYVYVILPVVRGVCGEATAWRVEQENARFECIKIDTGVHHSGPRRPHG